MMTDVSKAELEFAQLEQEYKTHKRINYIA